MRKVLATALAGVMLATSAIAVAPAAEARGWHHDRGHNGGSYRGYSGGGYYGGYRHHNNNAGAAIAGLALGAIIGGVIVSNNNRSYNNGYYGNGYYRDSYRPTYDNGHDARCFRQYGRSYDPSSDTFVGRDGQLYYCRL